MRYIKYILPLSIVLIFTSCGGGTSSAPTGSTAKVEVTDNSVCSKDYFIASVSSTLTNCVSCHSPNGQASSTRLILNEPLQNNIDNNFKVLKDFITLTDSLIVDKGSNTTPHSGGNQLTSANKDILQNFVEYIKNRKSCIVKSFDGVALTNDAFSLLSPKDTLQNASMKLSSSSATQAELDSTSTIDDLDKSLDNYMTTPAFDIWLHQVFNDFLLTDFYSWSRMGEDLLNRTDFPNARWYDNFRGTGVNQLNDSERRAVYESVNYAIYREPIELMIHIIKNNRPFSEILTADYVLVNPYSARSYGINIDKFTFTDADLNLTQTEFLKKYPKDWFKEAKIPHSKASDNILPSAGILTTITYLNRFPSTNTNLDRHRSAKTQLFFFDTDILSLASRPINSSENVDDTATWTNPNCTVCHNVMEPIASSFKNFDERGRYRPAFRTSASQAPGLSITNKTPQTHNTKLLQWLVSEMVKDNRFAMASVKMFYKAILGHNPIKKPQPTDTNYNEAMQAYNYENGILIQIRNKFIVNKLNAKVIIKEIIKSPLYRAKSTTATNSILSKNIGQAKLITPEELNQKIKNLTGLYWNGYNTQLYKDNNKTSRQKLLQSDMKILYGGINSNSVTKRTTQLNGVMAKVQMRMAMEMSGFATSNDFSKVQSNRKLFPLVTNLIDPIDNTNIDLIKKNIQYLQKHLLNENLDINDVEIEATYKLFYDTWKDGRTRVASKTEVNHINYSWYINKDLNTGIKIPDRNNYILEDTNYVMRSWSAVIAYLLSDFKFLYENSAN